MSRLGGGIVLVGALLLARALLQEMKPQESGKQERDIAYGVDGLAEQRFVGAALAIEEDVLA